MADSKLKLTIQTALDNAGIKATQDQIQSLEQGLTKVNTNFKNSSSSTFSGVNSGLTTIQKGVKTFMKDVAIAVGATKLIGTAMKEVYEGMISEGKSFSESWSNMWSKMADNMRKALFGTSVREIWEMVGKEAEKSAQKQIEAQNEIISKLDESRRKINDQTLAYVNQKDAISKLQRAGNDSQVLMLTAQKIMQTGKLKNMGDDQGAEQLEKLYDYMIEQRIGQNELDFAKNEIDKQAAKIKGDQGKMAEISKAYGQIVGRLSSAEKAWKHVGDEIAMATTEVDDESIKQSIAEKIGKERLKEYQSAQRAFKKIEEQYDKQLQVLVVDETDAQTLWQKYENTRLAADIRMNEKSQAYNDFIDANGNPTERAVESLKADRWSSQADIEFYQGLADNIQNAVDQMNQNYTNTFYRDEGHYEDILKATIENGKLLEQLL